MKFAKYLLTIAYLAVSISCSTAANTNQTNAGLQNISDSGTVINTADNENPETQTAAPDTVVKELLKLHKADKSPLYRAKTRAEMERFFAEDFVNLVWVGGNEPNLMNKLAIDSDLLMGLNGLSKSVGESIEKAKIDGNKATVPVTINVIDENGEKFKNLYDYELVKETGGWRVSDVKYNKSNGGSMVGTIKDLQKAAKESEKELDKEFENVKPPFVGTRWFVIEPGISGSGTPQYYLKINENNYAFCGFIQTNQADGTDTEEEVPLGRFKKIFNCNFNKDGMGVSRKFKVEGNYIYEVDKNNQVVKADECCLVGSDSEKCECKSEFYR